MYALICKRNIRIHFTNRQNPLNFSNLSIEVGVVKTGEIVDVVVFLFWMNL